VSARGVNGFTGKGESRQAVENPAYREKSMVKGKKRKGEPSATLDSGTGREERGVFEKMKRYWHGKKVPRKNAKYRKKKGRSFVVRKKKTLLNKGIKEKGDIRILASCEKRIKRSKKKNGVQFFFYGKSVHHLHKKGRERKKSMTRKKRQSGGT